MVPASVGMNLVQELSALLRRKTTLEYTCNTVFIQLSMVLDISVSSANDASGLRRVLG